METDSSACSKCGFEDTEFIRTLNKAVTEAHHASPQPEYQGVNRRKQRRVKCRFRVLLNGRPAILMDISAGGMRLSADFLPPDPKVELVLFTESGPVTLEGEIRWYSQMDPVIRQREAGISFTRIPDAFRAQLEKLTDLK